MTIKLKLIYNNNYTNIPHANKIMKGHAGQMKTIMYMEIYISREKTKQKTHTQKNIHIKRLKCYF